LQQELQEAAQVLLRRCLCVTQPPAYTTGALSQIVSSCCDAQALLEAKQLLQELDRKPANRTKRLMQFLNAQDFKLHFDLIEQELRDCLVQLSAILNISQFTSRVCLPASPLHTLFIRPPVLFMHHLPA
jgi:hypothetical protein